MITFSTLREICIIHGGNPSPKDGEFSNTGIPFIKMKDLGKYHHTSCLVTTENKVNESVISNKRLKVIPKGSILLPRSGSVAQNHRAILGQDSVIVSHICALEIKENNKVFNKYLYYYLTTIDMVKITKKTTGLDAITFEDLGQIKIPLLPLETQKRIADILDAADALRQKDQELLKKYDELAQAIFIEMFGDPVKNEKGWEKAPIGSITRVGSGGTPSRQIPEYFSGTIPWVKTTEVNGSIIYSTEENITEEALANSSCKVYPKDSIIIAMYGQGKTRGQVGILGVPSSTNQACGVISPSKRIIPEFLLQYLKMSYQDLRNLGRGGNQENLNKGMIEKFLIIIPPISLQIKYKETIENIISQVNELKHNESSILFNSLINNAFNGQLVA